MSGIGGIRAAFLRGAGILVLTTGMAWGQGANFALPSQPLSDSLKAVAQQTGRNILFTPQAVAGLVAPALRGQMSSRDAVKALLKGTNLGADLDGNGGLIVHALGGRCGCRTSAGGQWPSRDGGQGGTAIRDLRILPLPRAPCRTCWRRSEDKLLHRKARRSSRLLSVHRVFRSAPISSPHRSR